MLEHAKNYYDNLSQEDKNKVTADHENHKELINKIYACAKETHLYKDSNIEPNIIDLILTYTNFATMPVKQLFQIATPELNELTNNLKHYLDITNVSDIYNNLTNNYLIKE